MLVEREGLRSKVELQSKVEEVFGEQAIILSVEELGGLNEGNFLKSVAEIQGDSLDCWFKLVALEEERKTGLFLMILPRENSNFVDEELWSAFPVNVLAEGPCCRDWHDIAKIYGGGEFNFYFSIINDNDRDNEAVSEVVKNLPDWIGVKEDGRAGSYIKASTYLRRD